MNNYNKITTLVLSGGGIKGIGYIGIFKVFIKYIKLKQLKKIYAVSAGAIFITLLYLNYSLEELEKIVLNFDFNSLVPRNTIIKLFETMSLCNDDRLENLILDLLTYKGFDKSFSLKDFYKFSNIEINYAVSNISNKTLELWNYHNNPDIPLIVVLLATSRIPIIYSPIKYNNNIYLDGGILDNFPFEIKENNSNTTIGIWINHTIKLENNIIFKQNNTLIDIFNYFIFIIKLMIERFVSIKETIINFKIIKIDYGDVCNSYSFNISTKNKKQLIKLGYKQTIKNLNNL